MNQTKSDISANLENTLQTKTFNCKTFPYFHLKVSFVIHIAFSVFSLIILLTKSNIKS